MNIGEYKPIRIMLLAGGDLVQSFAAPDVWATADVSQKDSRAFVHNWQD